MLSETNAEPVSFGLVQKTRVLHEFLQEKHFSQRTVLDLGANAGYFSLKALQAGASNVVALDIDDASMAPLRQALDTFGLSQLRTVNRSVSDWSEPADIVFALALVHWVYSCTSGYGTVDGIIHKLASLTKYMCIVEWVDPEDPLIRDYEHTSWNTHLQSEPYTTAAFEKAMSKYFARWHYVGRTTSTRKLYVGFVTTKKREMGGPLPLLMDSRRVISSSMLCSIGGIDYWSRVYETEDGRILKQTTMDLAAREAKFLKALESSFVPKVISVCELDTHSSVEMERVNGVVASEGYGLLDSPHACFKFADALLEFLGILQAAGIQHRDLHADNVLIRQGLPVIIDFSWSTFPRNPSPMPNGLRETLPDQTEPCDIFSAGKVLQKLNRGRFPKFNFIHELMTAEDPLLRITDTNFLRKLCRTAVDSEKGSVADSREPSLSTSYSDREIAVLLDTLQRYQQVNKVLVERIASVTTEKDEANTALLEAERSPKALYAQTLQEQIARLENELTATRSSLSYKLATRLSALRRKLAPPGKKRGELVSLVFRFLAAIRQSVRK